MITFIDTSINNLYIHIILTLLLLIMLCFHTSQHLILPMNPFLHILLKKLLNIILLLVLMKHSIVPILLDHLSIIKHLAKLQKLLNKLINVNKFVTLQQTEYVIFIYLVMIELVV